MLSRKKQILQLAVFGHLIALGYALATFLLFIPISLVLPAQQATTVTALLFIQMAFVVCVLWIAGMIGAVICHRHLSANPQIKGWRLFKWRLAWPIAAPLYWYRFMSREK